MGGRDIFDCRRTAVCGGGHSVCVVLFQPELRRMLVKNLTAAGYTVDGVPDGAETLAYLDAAAYDAAVLDIMMPKVDGLTVLRTLRARGSALPVLLLTARDAVADRVDGLDAGADDYLITPTAEYPRPGTNPPKTEFINIKSPGMWLTCRQYLGILKREN